MKKNKILIFAVLLLSMVIIFMTTAFAAGQPQLKLQSATLELKNAIFMKFKVKAENVAKVSDVKLLLWEEAPTTYKKGTEKEALPLYSVEGNTGYLVFRYDQLSAKEMGKQVYICAYAKIGGREYYSSPQKYSILQYAYNKINAASPDVGLVNVITKMLEYGSAAQIYFDHHTEFLATDEVAKIQVVNGTLADGTRTGYCKAGTSVTVTADAAASGKVFLCWKNSAGEIVGRDSVLTIPSCVSETYTAFYRTQGENDAALLQAISQAGAKVDAMKALFEDERVHYTAEDMMAIREILGAAQAAISECLLVEDVDAALAKMEEDLAKFPRVDDSIYAYYVALGGNITAESEALVEEAVDALKAAKKFYDKAGLPEALTEYEISEDECINLVDAIDDLAVAQLVKLPQLKADAKALVEAIDEAATKYDVDVLEELLAEYKVFVKAAKKLSEKNVALVTNADKLMAALEDAENVEAALSAIQTSAWEFPSIHPSTFGEDVNIFGDYEAFVADDEQVRFVLPTLKSAASDEKVCVSCSTFYDAIDARLAEFAEEYEISETAVAWVIAEWKGDANFYARYESDKALAKAFEAEYEKFMAEDGVFTSVKALSAATLTPASAYELVMKFRENAEAIDAFRNEFAEAYRKEYLALEDKNTVSFTVEEYLGVIEDNFVTMAHEAKLGEWYYNDRDEEWIYYGYGYGFNTYPGSGNEFYFGLYPFVYMENEQLADFLQVIFPAANAAAKAINTSINDYRENQALSIVDLVVQLGGYHTVAINEDGKPMLTAINTDTEAFEDGLNGYAIGTIAWFMHEYKTEDYDLSGLINVEHYEQKLSTVEKNVEEADKALRSLMSAYEALLGDKGTVVVTLDNADRIIELEALLVKVHTSAHVDMFKATVVDVEGGLKTYELSSIVEDYLSYGMTPQDFYNEILLSTDYADTVKGAVDTGEITRLIYKAKALKKEEAIVISAYNMMQKLNAVYGGQAFSYATNQNGYELLLKMNNVNYRNLATYGYMYGVLSYEATSKIESGNTVYGYKITFVRFNADKGGFYVGSRDSMMAGEMYTTADEAVRGAWNYVRMRFPTGAINIASNVEFYDYMFAEDGYLRSTIKVTDSEELNNVFRDRIIPSFVLPMMASYLESKFLINNMGKTTDAILAAKNGWGEPTSNYGFGYIKAMVVNQFRVEGVGKISSSRLAAIGDTTNYDRLTLAVKSICQDINLVNNIVFGHADATWLSKTYDIRVKDYAIGGCEELGDVGYGSTYADHGIDLDKLVTDALVIYKYEESDPDYLFPLIPLPSETTAPSGAETEPEPDDEFWG